MPLNVRLLRLEVIKQSNKSLLPTAKKFTKIDFDHKKERLLDNFDSHDVTVELEAGPRAFSKFLSSTEGNLFSLLGFEESENPTKELRRFLKDSITLGTTRIGKTTGDTITFETPVSMPTLQEVNDHMAVETPLPWTERSFVDLIQNGVTGLPSYLFDLTRKFANSYSGTAIQVKRIIRQGSVRPISYVNGLLADFKKTLSPRK